MEREWTYLSYELHLIRIPYFILINFVCPCALMEMLSVSSHLLPMATGERVSVGLALMMGCTVMLLVVINHIPTSSRSISVLAIYVTKVRECVS